MPSPKKILEYMYCLEALGTKKGLGRIKKLLKELGNPHLSYPCVLIAGTNGKGSTAAMLASILSKAGFKAGLYTSPHLSRFNERVKVGNKLITDAELSEIALKVKRIREGKSIPATFFEFTTAIAFEHFRREKIDIAVLETGMGGRLDATNVTNPVVSIITNIGLDHQEFLGETLEEIAFEKAGIIKRGGLLVTAEQSPRIKSLLQKSARKKGSAFYSIGADFRVAGANEKISYYGINKNHKNLSIGLAGAHQRENASLAIAAAELLKNKGFSIDDNAISTGLEKALWPGRLEVLSKKPFVMIDAAHNPAGAMALKKHLQKIARKKVIFVAGIMADKDFFRILKELSPVAKEFIIARPDTKRAAGFEPLEAALKRFHGPVINGGNVKDACSMAISRARKDDIICVTGSIYTIGEARSFLRRVL